MLNIIIIFYLESSPGAHIGGTKNTAEEVDVLSSLTTALHVAVNASLRSNIVAR